MCLINFQLNDHPTYKLVMLANRDEFYNRPTEAANFWPDSPDLLAGRDLLQMGTWLGVTKKGRIAALTNFRDPSTMEPGKRSRGEIVSNFLSSDLSPQEFWANLKKEEYTGFNVILGNADQLFYFSNMEEGIQEISPGIHGLSNHLLNTPWPKVVKGKRNLAQYLAEHEKAELDPLFDFLADAEQADDFELPDTGIGWEFERKLSSAFIATPDYGTRSATVLLIDRNNQLTFAERTFNDGSLKNQQVFTFSID